MAMQVMRWIFLPKFNSSYNYLRKVFSYVSDICASRTKDWIGEKGFDFRHILGLIFMWWGIIDSAIFIEKCEHSHLCVSCPNICGFFISVTGRQWYRFHFLSKHVIDRTSLAELGQGGRMVKLRIERDGYEESLPVESKRTFWKK